MRRDLGTISFYGVVLYLLFTADGYSYIDPGSGSIVIQVLIASLLGLLTMLRIYWAKVKSIFSGSSDQTVQGDEIDDNT